MPPVEDIGPDPLQLHFIFSVSDQQGGVLSGLLFNITVLPVDDQAPQVRVQSSPVPPAGRGSAHLLLSGSCRCSPTCYRWRRAGQPC